MTRRLRRFSRLTSIERAQVLRSLVYLACASAALNVFSYGTLRRWIDRTPVRRRRSLTAASNYARAIARASTVVTPARCLSQALAAAWMLHRDGQDSTLVIGVRLDDARHLQAHAWLESGDVIVSGSREMTGHHPLFRDPILVRR